MRKVIAETSRLTIRNWLLEDIDPYAEIIADPDVMQFIGNGEVKLTAKLFWLLKSIMDKLKLKDGRGLL